MARPRPGDDEPRRITREAMKTMRAQAHDEGRARWNVPDALRTEVLWGLAQVLGDPHVSVADRVAVAKTLAVLDRTDQRDDLIEIRRGLPPGPEPVPIDPRVAAAALRAALEEADRLAAERNGDGQPADAKDD